MKRIGMIIGIVAVIFIVFAAGWKLGSLQQQKIKPKSMSVGYNGEFRYPNIPAEFRSRNVDEERQFLLRTANNRSQIVNWADVNNIHSVQDLEPGMFLLSNNIGYGLVIWVFYLYIRINDEWRLIYVGDAGLRDKEALIWENGAYFDWPKKAVIFIAKDGRVLSTLSIKHEMKLLHKF